ncbi:MAG: hypothetical protein IT249_09200 [Chitinophagaceae bacterium]|nr:hypothetical protein [Chitinophagaceae bacterium]
MGLIEKRATKAFQDNAYASLTNEINTIAGFPVEFDVKWDTLAVSDYSHLYEEAFTKVYFTPVINAFKEITIDDLGKEALKETVKKIVIKNEGGFYYGESAYSYSNGTLTIDHQPVTNVDDIDSRTNYLIKLLSSKM